MPVSETEFEISVEFEEGGVVDLFVVGRQDSMEGRREFRPPS